MTLPSSGSHAEDGFLNAVVVRWALGVAVACAAIALANVEASRFLWLPAAAMIFVPTLTGWVVAQRLDVAWIESCSFGTDSGGRRLDSDGATAPTFAHLVWLVAGASIGATGVVASRWIRRHNLGR